MIHDDTGNTHLPDPLEYICGGCRCGLPSKCLYLVLRTSSKEVWHFCGQCETRWRCETGSCQYDGSHRPATSESTFLSQFGLYQVTEGLVPAWVQEQFDLTSGGEDFRTIGVVCDYLAKEFPGADIMDWPDGGEAHLFQVKHRGLVYEARFQRSFFYDGPHGINAFDFMHFLSEHSLGEKLRRYRPGRIEVRLSGMFARHEYPAAS